MKYSLIIENWKKFLYEVDVSPTTTTSPVSPTITPATNKTTIKTFGDLQKLIGVIQKNKKLSKTGEASLDLVLDQVAGLIPGASNIKTAFDFFKTIYSADDTKKTNTWLDKINIDDNYTKIVDDSVENAFLQNLLLVLSKKNAEELLPKDYNINKELEIFLKTKYNSRTLQGAVVQEAKKKKSGDRCTRIAKRKYDTWPSAYASGAVVRCRRGEIWKGISENATDEEIDLILEKWSEKYKRSIDCKNPKGFSQKTHCQGKKLNENTTSNLLEDVAAEAIRYFNGKSEKTAMKNTIYFYYTKDESVKDEILKLVNDPAKRKQYNEYWEKVKTKLQEISKNNNWTIADDGAWFQMTKPYTTTKNFGNFKYYITFQKGQKFFDNVNKLGKLLTALNSKKTNGKVSFKIASIFGSAYQHKDSVVIHFNYKEDQQLVSEAIKECNFETIDRAQIGRTDLGRDDDTSDSDLVARKALENIEKNKNVLLPLLTSDKNSQEYKKGLSGLKHIMDTLMQQSSHRNVSESKKRDYKPNFSKEKEQGLHGWFARNKGKGWINCRTGGPCGRSSADKKGGKYPACRPTKAQCKSAGKGPLRRKKSSKPISWTKKKKKD